MSRVIKTVKFQSDGGNCKRVYNALGISEDLAISFLHAPSDRLRVNGKFSWDREGLVSLLKLETNALLTRIPHSLRTAVPDLNRFLILLKMALDGSPGREGLSGDLRALQVASRGRGDIQHTAMETLGIWYLLLASLGDSLHHLSKIRPDLSVRGANSSWGYYRMDLSLWRTGFILLKESGGRVHESGQLRNVQPYPDVNSWARGVFSFREYGNAYLRSLLTYLIQTGTLRTSAGTDALSCPTRGNRRFESAAAQYRKSGRAAEFTAYYGQYDAYPYSDLLNWLANQPVWLQSYIVTLYNRLRVRGAAEKIANSPELGPLFKPSDQYPILRPKDVYGTNGPSDFRKSAKIRESYLGNLGLLNWESGAPGGVFNGRKYATAGEKWKAICLKQKRDWLNSKLCGWVNSAIWL